jgi:hypothetical protein
VIMLIFKKTIVFVQSARVAHGDDGVPARAPRARRRGRAPISHARRPRTFLITPPYNALYTLYVRKGRHATAYFCFLGRLWV